MNRTFNQSWTLAIAILAGVALSASTLTAVAQTPGQPVAQNATSTIMLSGPSGDRLTLVHTSEAGWQLQADWPAGQPDASPRITQAVFPDVHGMAAGDRPVLESPLTVFVDGPTGYTFIYVLDEGWKFVGQVAGSTR